MGSLLETDFENVHTTHITALDLFGHGASLPPATNLEKHSYGASHCNYAPT